MAEKPPPYPQQQPPSEVYPQPGYPQAPAYHPQQPGYPSQPSAYATTQPGYATTSTTIIQQPQVLMAVSFRESPVATTCPTCRASVVTATNYVTGTLTWLACLGLCVIGCDLFCCLIPFCVDCTKDVIHTCPSCGNQIGVYRRT